MDLNQFKTKLNNSAHFQEMTKVFQADADIEVIKHRNRILNEASRAYALLKELGFTVT